MLGRAGRYMPGKLGGYIPEREKLFYDKHSSRQAVTSKKTVERRPRDLLCSLATFQIQ